jgi:hypothetical protein
MKTKSGSNSKSDVVVVVNPVQNTSIMESDVLTEQDTRQMVYDGSLALQYSLFKHAKDQRPKLNRLKHLICKIEDKIYTEDIIDQLDNQQLLKLYSTANNQVTSSIEFLERLHKLVQDTEDVNKVTNSLNISIDGSITNPIDAIRYRSKSIDNEKLKNVKEILISNILGSVKDDNIIDVESYNIEEESD